MSDELEIRNELGPMVYAVRSAQYMLADCPVFRALVDAADSAAALNRIHRNGVPNPPANPEKGYTEKEHEQYRPCAIVYHDHGTHGMKMTSATGFESYGVIMIELIKGFPSNATAADRSRLTDDFEISCSKLVLELMERGGRSAGDVPFPSVDSVKVVDGPGECSIEERRRSGRHLGAVLELAYPRGGPG